MILDLDRFLREETPYWKELEQFLSRLTSDPFLSLDLEQLERFHYLYQRAAGDLVKLGQMSGSPDIHKRLESLVGRAYEEMHEVRHRRSRFSFRNYLRVTLPVTFRRHFVLFLLAFAALMLGMIFGGTALLIDPGAKSAIMPFPHLHLDPEDRVAMEESFGGEDHLQGVKNQFFSELSTHNTRVSINMMAMGITWGVGTIFLLFYNGVILGAVILDYLQAGQGLFLAGWLLPHGAIEIPAILMAGQTGCLIGKTLIGAGQEMPLGDRFRRAGPDAVVLISGVALLLIWSGFVEAFFSQYHSPVIPYEYKITFGILELLGLTAYLGFAGRDKADPE